MKYPIKCVHQIEITSRCNLKCRYCPSYRLPRPKMDMEPETWHKSLAWAARLNATSRHNELNLAGIGESTLHPMFVEWVHEARQAMGPWCRIVLATNGLLMDDAMAQAIAPARPDVYVSLHRPEKAMPAVEACKRAGILSGVSCDGAVQAVDWAGQIDWPVTTTESGKDCDWTTDGKVVVFADGRVSRCCFDASGAGVICTIDDDLTQFAHSPYSLCDTCHLKNRAEVTP